MMMTARLVDKGRIQSIDCIRGIALLGILVINVQTYSLFAFLRPQQVYALQLDQPDTYAPVQFFIHLFVKGQFYTLYSFLFGLGFYQMWEKNNRAGLDANRIYKRRLWALLLFGLIHAFLFWFGDILHKYALLGFTLLYFNRKSVPTLLRWIAGLAALVIVSQVINGVVFAATPEARALRQQQFDTVVMQVVTTWQNGSVLEVMSLQKLGVAMLHVMTVKQGLASYAQYEMMFLLGLIAGKLHLYHRIAQVKHQFLLTAFWLFPFGLLLKGIAGLPLFDVHLFAADKLAYEQLVYSVTDFIGTPLLSIDYIIELSLFFTRKPSRFTRWIGNAGRMGLTNYLLQTLLCMGLFYGYGLGLSGRLTLLESLLVALGLYGFQVILSNWWLGRHPRGPMEALWRRFTYGKSIPMIPLSNVDQ
jgi:uncharacterized protein